MVNFLASGLPASVANFFAGGNLTALNIKLKDGYHPEIQPIAVSEALRWLTGKCLCALVKVKASELFQALHANDYPYAACQTGGGW